MRAKCQTVRKTAGVTITTIYSVGRRSGPSVAMSAGTLVRVHRQRRSGSSRDFSFLGKAGSYWDRPYHAKGRETQSACGRGTNPRLP